MGATFTLDTSGGVMIEFAPGCDQLHTWDRLSPFAQGYVEAMFANARLEIMARHDVGCDPDYRDAGFSDLSPEALALILRDCERHQEATKAVLGVAQSDAESGRAFWNFRQAVKGEAFPPLTPFLSEDGKVCLRESGQ